LVIFRAEDGIELEYFFGRYMSFNNELSSFADSKSMAVKAPSAISSAVSGRHRQNTLIFPKQYVIFC